MRTRIKVQTPPRAGKEAAAVIWNKKHATLMFSTKGDEAIINRLPIIRICLQVQSTGNKCFITNLSKDKFDFREIKPDESLKVVNHSIDGFNWGYNGSGPAQLALAILIEFLPLSLARKHYQQFKSEFIATKATCKDYDFCINLKDIITRYNT